MTERQTEIANKIVEYIRVKGRCPNFASIGTDWYEGHPVFEMLFDNGTLVRAIQVSPKGRKMEVVRLAV